MIKYLLGILFITLSINAYAGGDSTYMQHFNIEKGLPSNGIYSVAEDDLGYIWFSTDNGLVKYNGYSYKVFTASNGLPTKDVWKLYLDKRGRLWVHTHAYKIGYIKNDQYKTMVTSTKIIYPIYIASDNRNTYFLYNESNHFRLVTVDSADSITNTDLSTQSAILSPKCILYTRDNNTFYKRDLSRGEKDLQKTCTINNNNNNPFSFTANTTGIFYNTIYNFSFLNNYAQTINTDNCEVKKIDLTDIKGQSEENIYTAYTNQDSLVLITSKNIYIFDSSFKMQEKIQLAPILPPSSQVAYYFEDKFRNTWFTTNGDGAWCKVRPSEIFHINNTLDVLSNAKMVGTAAGGSSFWWQKESTTLYILDSGKKISTYSFPKNTLLRGVSAAGESEAFLCFNQSLSIYNTQTKHFSNFITKYHIRHLVEDIKGGNNAPLILNDSLAINQYLTNKTSVSLTHNGFFIKGYVGVSVAQLSGDTLFVHTLEQERYTDMIHDTVDNLFILYNGAKLSIFDPITEKKITLTPEELSYLNINSISAAEVDRFSNLYVIDNEKLVIYNFRSGQIKYVTTDFNFIDAQLKIYNDQLIISGLFGLSYAKIKGPLSISSFNVIANAKNSYYSRLYSQTINNERDILLASDKGIFDIYMSSLRIKNAIFNPASNEFFKLTLSTPYQAVIKDNDTLVIDQKNQKINLDAINFFGTGSVQYHYYISGYNTDWQQSVSGEMYIGDIKPHAYYKVYCTVSDNLWKRKEIIFYLYVPPYWYQSIQWKVFFWICGVLLVLTALLLVILSTRTIVARSNEKKRMLTELELRAVYAQINPHFVFNTLSAALYFINKKRFDDAYIHVNKFSRLIRAYLKSSQDRYILLSEEIEMLSNYMDLQRTRFEGKFDFNIDVDNKLPTQNIRIPSLLVQPLVENAINHGLFHKGEGGHLELKFMQGADGSELICIIDDNGVGRERAKELKKHNSAKPESYGTKLTQQLIEIFKEYEKMDISLEYIDKQSPNTGTTVIITIKNIKYVT